MEKYNEGAYCVGGELFSEQVQDYLQKNRTYTLGLKYESSVKADVCFFVKLPPSQKKKECEVE